VGPPDNRPPYQVVTRSLRSSKFATSTPLENRWVTKVERL